MLLLKLVRKNTTYHWKCLFCDDDDNELSDTVCLVCNKRRSCGEIKIFQEPAKRTLISGLPRPNSVQCFVCCNFVDYNDAVVGADVCLHCAKRLLREGRTATELIQETGIEIHERIVVDYGNNVNSEEIITVLDAPSKTIKVLLEPAPFHS